MAAEIVIHDQNHHLYLPGLNVVDGEVKSHGLILRDFSKQPHGYCSHAPKFDLPIIPRSEWPARFAAYQAAKAQLSNVRNTGGPNGQPIPSRDQNGKGYCWAHSGVSAALVARAMMNQPYEDLSAYAVACIIKGYRDEGGNGIDGVEWQAQNGCPTSKTWAQKSMSRSNDNAAMRAEAAKYKIADWSDFDPGAMEDQLVTWLLLGVGPVVVDYNWWSHSVCCIDLTSVNPLGVRIWNSWGDNWSQNGTGELTGSKALPDNAVGCRVVSAAA